MLYEFEICTTCIDFEGYGIRHHTIYAKNYKCAVRALSRIMRKSPHRLRGYAYTITHSSRAQNLKHLSQCIVFAPYMPLIATAMPNLSVKDFMCVQPMQ